MLKNDDISLNQHIFTVGELTKHIKDLLRSDEKLNNIFVKGEISNLTKPSSGHTYFTLKDEESQIKCSLFKRLSENLKFELEHGLKIIVIGKIDVYEPYGYYNIVVEDVQPDGLGALNLAFMQLKNKLEKEGLFSKEHKKSLPKFPKTIAIITSPTGAVIQDIKNVLRRRYPLVKVLIIPTPVQGKEATPNIVNSIKIANKTPNIDLIILARGGGSLEDLWCFNEESVARAIFDSKIPIISAIGHETDFTIADFVADKRAETPSVAAEISVPDIKEIIFNLSYLLKKSSRLIRIILEKNKIPLKQALNRPVFRRPYDKINSYSIKVDDLNSSLSKNFKRYTENRKKVLEKVHDKLDILNPKSVLKRGYSIVVKDNKTVKDSVNLKVEEDISIILFKGKIDAKIKRVVEDKNGI